MARRWVALIFGAAVLLAVIVIGAIGLVLVFSNPAGDARYEFASPSGLARLYLIESCERDGCMHQAVVEIPTLDGDMLQVRCGLDVESTGPVFSDAAVAWTPNENGVLVEYGEDQAAELSLEFSRDCNA